MKDISLHILDVAQNSISAGAKNILIEIDENRKTGKMKIIIDDNGRGMPPEIVQQVTDPYYTTRTTRKVGLGLPLFKQSAMLTGGNLFIESQPGKGTRVTVEFDMNHIDCLPMGDMPGVIMILVGGTSGIEWTYRHKVNDKEYVFDTHEVKEALDGLDIRDPAVIKYLREMIRENLIELRSGA
ncbi:MAG: ATP-binding protein [Bacteroidota bacterium]